MLIDASILLRRFAYSHLVGKCRRQIILQHFGEDTTDVCSRERCCDVCKGLTTTTNMQPEITSILQALKKIPGKGEKKVCMLHCMISLAPRLHRNQRHSIPTRLVYNQL